MQTYNHEQNLSDCRWRIPFWRFVKQFYCKKAQGRMTVKMTGTTVSNRVEPLKTARKHLCTEVMCTKCFPTSLLSVIGQGHLAKASKQVSMSTQIPYLFYKLGSKMQFSLKDVLDRRFMRHRQHVGYYATIRFDGICTSQPFPVVNAIPVPVAYVMYCCQSVRIYENVDPDDVRLLP